MQSWEEYIKSNILKFRELYVEIEPETRRTIEKDFMSYSSRLNKPCQVLVITYSDFPDVFLVIVNSKKMKDMKIIVNQNMNFEGFWDNDENKEMLIEFSGWNNLKVYRDSFKPFSSNTPNIPQSSAHWDETSLFLHLNQDPRYHEYMIAEKFLKEVKLNKWNFERKKQSKKIETTVDDLKRDAKAIPETVQLKNKILETASRLENQIEDLNKKVEDEVLALREMVGTDKDRIGWTVFTKDIKHLKETHVAKGEFTSEIKRLDEKIENKTEALNTRIEDLKAIKFWSKRTLLEIALFIWGAIVTLYSTGIIKF